MFLEACRHSANCSPLGEHDPEEKANRAHAETGERRLDILDLQKLCDVLGVSLVGFAQKFDHECKKI